MTHICVTWPQWVVIRFYLQSVCGNIGDFAWWMWVESSEMFSPTVFFSINIIQFILLSALVRYVAGNIDTTVYKRRMCLQYEIEDYTSTATVIDRQYYCSKVECMTSCTHHISCNTFHFRAAYCVCELLDTSEKCMPHNVTISTTLVRLSECTGIPPWKVITPTERKLQWMEPRGVGSQGFLFADSKAKRQVARVLHEGTYLPGFVLVSRGEFYGSTLKARCIRCSEAFQVLTYVHPDDYLWIHFAPGDDIPASAVVGGYWRDGTALYVVIGQNKNVRQPGFYNAATEKVYVRSRAIQPLAMELLLDN